MKIEWEWIMRKVQQIQNKEMPWAEYRDGYCSVSVSAEEDGNISVSIKPKPTE